MVPMYLGTAFFPGFVDAGDTTLCNNVETGFGTANREPPVGETLVDLERHLTVWFGPSTNQ